MAVQNICDAAQTFTKYLHLSRANQHKGLVLSEGRSPDALTSRARTFQTLHLAFCNVTVLPFCPVSRKKKKSHSQDYVAENSPLHPLVCSKINDEAGWRQSQMLLCWRRKFFTQMKDSHQSSRLCDDCGPHGELMGDVRGPALRSSPSKPREPNPERRGAQENNINLKESIHNIWYVNYKLNILIF